MSKKIKNIKKYTIKKVTVDPLYKSYWYSKFLNKLMLSGKKHIVEKIMSQIVYQFKIKYHVKPIRILFASMIKLKPLVKLVSVRKGREYKLVPFPLKPRQQLTFALKGLVAQIKISSDITLRERITRTLITLLRDKKKKKHTETNVFIKMRNLHYHQAGKNRINSRFRWQ